MSELVNSFTHQSNYLILSMFIFFTLSIQTKLIQNKISIGSPILSEGKDTKEMLNIQHWCIYFKRVVHSLNADK